MERAHEQMNGMLDRRAFVQGGAAAVVAASLLLGGGAGPARADVLLDVAGRLGAALGTSPKTRIRRAAGAYLSTLIQQRDAILAYDWQDNNGGAYGWGGAEDVRGFLGWRHTALFDVDGDGVPELLFMGAADTGTGEADTLELNVVRYDGGKACSAFSSCDIPTVTQDARWQAYWGEREGLSSRGVWGYRHSSSSFCLFSAYAGDETAVYATSDPLASVPTRSQGFYAYLYVGTHSPETHLLHLTIDRASGALVQAEPPYSRVERVFSDSGGVQETRYFRGAERVSQAEVEAKFEATLANVDQVIMYSGSPYHHGDAIGDCVMQKGQLAQPYGWAVNALCKLSERDAVAFSDDGEGSRASRVSSTMDDLLSYPSTRYNPRLSYLLATAAQAAYDPSQALVRDTMASLGCTSHVYTFNYYDDPYDPAYGKDSVGFALGEGELTDGRRLVMVVVRGSYGALDVSNLSPDWVSDANMGQAMILPARHYGFSVATAEVYAQLCKWLGRPVAGDNTVYVTCGHSRGAAVSNLLAVTLSEQGVPQENVYSYNFACPDVARDWPSAWNRQGEHDNIFNIANAADPISVIPGYLMDTSTFGLFGLTLPLTSFGTAWGKYGINRWYAKDWNSAGSTDLEVWAHDGKRYVDDLRGEIPLSKMKDYMAMRLSSIGNLTGEYFGEMFEFFTAAIAKNPDLTTSVPPLIVGSQ